MGETTKTLKKVVAIDLLIGALIGTFIFMFFKEHTMPFFIGLFMAIVSFAINTFFINYSFDVRGKSQKGLCTIGLFLRIIFVCIVALVLLKVNKYYVFSYILGYNCNILSLLIYSKLI